MKKGNNGITVIALIVTIIVLLIIAGVGISMITGDNGILTKAQTAKDEYNSSETLETERLDKLSEIMESTSRDGNTNSESSVITSVDFEVKNVASKSVSIKITTNTINNNKILGYHIFAVSNVDSEIIADMSVNADFELSGLKSNTSYSIYVKAYDINDNYKISVKKDITTPKVLYLYDNGNLCTANTGGWEVMYGRYYPSSYVTLNPSNMTFVYGGYIGTKLNSNYLVQYKYLNIECSSNYTRNKWTQIAVKNLNGLAVNQTQGFYNSNAYKILVNVDDYTKWDKKTFKVDISDWNVYDSKGLAIECCEGRDIELYSVYLSD